jgi:hypothetical protein
MPDLVDPFGCAFPGSLTPSLAKKIEHVEFALETSYESVTNQKRLVQRGTEHGPVAEFSKRSPLIDAASKADTGFDINRDPPGDSIGVGEYLVVDANRTEGENTMLIKTTELAERYDFMIRVVDNLFEIGPVVNVLNMT